MTTQPTTEAKAQHTPGPWRINGSVITAQGDMKLTVAIVPCKADARPLADAAAVSFAQRDANARLIAAAPELIEACRVCATALTVTQFNQGRDMASAAIARATQ